MRLFVAAAFALAHTALMASWSPIAAKDELSLYSMGSHVVLLSAEGNTAIVVDALDNGPLSMCDDAVRTMGWANIVIFPALFVGVVATMTRFAVAVTVVRNALWIAAGVAVARTVATWIFVTKPQCTVSVFGTTTDWVVGPGTVLGTFIDAGIVAVAAYPLFPTSAAVYAAIRRQKSGPAYMQVPM